METSVENIQKWIEHVGIRSVENRGFEQHYKQTRLDRVIIPHPTTGEYIIFSSAHRTFSRIEHILGYKTILNTFWKIKII